jgi:hypothetical protein
MSFGNGGCEWAPTSAQSTQNASIHLRAVAGLELRSGGTNLGLTYARIPDGNRPENLKSAKEFLESVLRVYTENGFPNDHHAVVNKLANVKP